MRRLFLLLLAASSIASAEPGAAQRLRIVGGLAGVHQYTLHEEPFWSRELPVFSNGRLSAEIVPFDRAGIQSQEMLRLVRLGAVPFGTALLASASGQDPELLIADLAGLNPDIATLRRTVAAVLPFMAGLLRERYGIELLAIYIYPAQVPYCKRPFARLADLAGRRVRVSSPSQWDFFAGLGATPVQTPFADIVSGVAAGNLDCAVTGTMTGNTIGLHETTSHIHAMAVSWGVALFVANGTAWQALGADAQALLRRELARLERSIWAAAAAETLEGVACNAGRASCRNGRKGRMSEVRESPDDVRRRQELLTRHVLPGWLKRCGNGCGTLWRQTVGPALGIPLS